MARAGVADRLTDTGRHLEAAPDGLELPCVTCRTLCSSRGRAANISLPWCAGGERLVRKQTGIPGHTAISAGLEDAVPYPAPYCDPTQPTDARVNDLLSRMTMAEKIGQMCQLDGRIDAEKWMTDHHVGSFLHLVGDETRRLQQLARQTRLGIPLLFGIDAIHGHGFYPTATVFPTQLAMSCAWDPQLTERVARATAVEVATTGIHWTFSPELDVARDLRWGRVDETFGEDPFLVGELGAAMVRGYQGSRLSDPTSILACPKHFAGYSCTQGGRDASEADLTRRHLKTVFLRPFLAAVQAGCATVMTGYQAVDGVPCTVNRWLLRDTLKDDWGFNGFIITDWDNIGRLYREQFVCESIDTAIKRAIESGNDMVMSTPEFPAAALRLVESGQLTPSLIDQACARILRVKFELGLFDATRSGDPQTIQQWVGCAAHRELAAQIARESLVLLKNDRCTLPLRNVKQIAVVGPNAHDMAAQLGDWVFLDAMGEEFRDAPGRYEAPTHRDTVTILDGIRRRAGASIRVGYAQGCDIRGNDRSGFAEAVSLAESSDVVVAVVGDCIKQNGEVRDRADLDLSGVQSQLLEALHATGKPLVVVLINGKPLSVPWVQKHASAIVEAFNPGIEGGTAVASLLFGDHNPSGKLTISFPHHVGQQPVFYNQVPGWHATRYGDMPETPLFAFGFGLSFTTFAYANLHVSPVRDRAHDSLLEVEVDLTNTGDRAGVEIAQLYVRDCVSSVTTAKKQLAAFQRISLNPGETERLHFEVPLGRLALIDENLEAVVEPGRFEIMVGGSSRSEDLLTAAVDVP